MESSEKDNVDSDTGQSDKDNLKVQTISSNSHTVNACNTCESSDKPNCNKGIEIVVSDSEDDKEGNKGVARPKTPDKPKDSSVIICDTSDARNESSDSFRSDASVKKHSNGFKLNNNLVEISSDSDRSRSPIRPKNGNDRNSKEIKNDSAIKSNVEVIVSDTSDNSATNQIDSNLGRSAPSDIPNVAGDLDSTVIMRNNYNDASANPQSTNLNLNVKYTSDVTNVDRTLVRKRFKVASVKRKLIDTCENKADSRRVTPANVSSNFEGRVSVIKRESSENYIVTVNPALETVNQATNKLEKNENPEGLKNTTCSPHPTINGKRRFDSSGSDIDNDENNYTDDCLEDRDDSVYQSRHQMKKSFKVKCKNHSKCRKIQMKSKTSDGNNTTVDRVSVALVDIPDAKNSETSIAPSITFNIPNVSIVSEQLITANIATGSKTNLINTDPPLECLNHEQMGDVQSSDPKVACANNEDDCCITNEQFLDGLTYVPSTYITDNVYNKNLDELPTLQSVPVENVGFPLIETSSNNRVSNVSVTSDLLTGVPNEVAFGGIDPSLLVSSNDNLDTNKYSEHAQDVTETLPIIISEILPSDVTSNNEIYYNNVIVTDSQLSVSNVPQTVSSENEIICDNLTSCQPQANMPNVCSVNRNNNNYSDSTTTLNSSILLFPTSCTSSNNEAINEVCMHPGRNRSNLQYLFNLNVISNNQNIETTEIDDDSTNSGPEKSKSQNVKESYGQGNNHQETNIELDIEKHLTSYKINKTSTSTYNSHIQTIAKYVSQIKKNKIALDNDSDPGPKPIKENIDSQVSLPKSNPCKTVRRKIRITTIKRRVIDNGKPNRNIEVIEIDDNDEDKLGSDTVNNKDSDSKDSTKTGMKISKGLQTYEISEIIDLDSDLDSDMVTSESRANFTKENVIIESGSTDLACTENVYPIDQNNSRNIPCDMDISESKANTTHEERELNQACEEVIQPIEIAQSEMNPQMTQDETSILNQTYDEDSQLIETEVNTVKKIIHLDEACEQSIHPCEINVLLDDSSENDFGNTRIESNNLDQVCNENFCPIERNGLSHQVLNEGVLIVAEQNINHDQNNTELELTHDFVNVKVCSAVGDVVEHEISQKINNNNSHQHLDNLEEFDNKDDDTIKPDVDTLIEDLVVLSENDETKKTSVLDEQVVDFVLDNASEKATAEKSCLEDGQFDSRDDNEENIDKLVVDYILNTDGSDKCADSNNEVRMENYRSFNQYGSSNSFQDNQRQMNVSNTLKHSNVDVSRLCLTPERNILNSVPPPIMVF